MSPGILEIAKERDDDDLNYLEIEIYKDWDFWKGLGIPIIISVPLAYIFFFIGVTLDQGGGACLPGVCSIFCLWPILGGGMLFDAKRVENDRYKIGAWSSITIYLITILVIIGWLVMTFNNLGYWF